MATISSSKTLRLLPLSSQLRNALAYMLITSLALLLLNYFSAKTTRELMFRAKYASAQDKIQVVASAFSGVDPLTPESAEQVISVLGNINAARLIVTNAEGTAVYDSSENQNAIGQRVLLPAWWRRCAAATCSTARIRTTRSSALPPSPSWITTVRTAASI
ncbi:MAG: hypothetical protein V8T01_11290 [Oscillospiraceae bacterium]